jgi:hypothetical protein
MTTATRTHGYRPAAVMAGVAAASAAGLMFEIVLTRVFAVTQFYHFAFLSVSMALLGFGASGTALTIFPTLGRGGPRRWATLAALQGVATVGAYAVVNLVPFDSFAIAWDRRQVWFLVIDYLALAAPFFFGGALVGALLSAGRALGSHRIYGASLAGSGLGTVLALVLVDLAGAEAAVVVAGAVAIAASGLLLASDPHSGRWGRGAVALAVIGMLVLAVALPAPLRLRLSPYKDLSGALRYPGARVVATGWDSGARVDHIESAGIRSLPGLSLAFQGLPPPQDAVTLDGDSLNSIPLVMPDEAEFAAHMLGSLPYLLRSGGDVLVLEPRGGLDVLLALAAGAATVTAVEPHHEAVIAARRRAGNHYDDPRVATVDAEPRTFLERTGTRSDVVALALTSPYRPVTSGAYSLSEDYTLTVEAFEAYLDVLAPGGLVAAMRWMQTPPSEETRLVATGAEALRRRGRDPAASIVAVRGYAVQLVLLRPDGFDDADLQAIRSFAAEERFDLVAGPGITADDVNRFNVVPDAPYSGLAGRLLSTTAPAEVYAEHSFDIRPPTDDRPFFAHFFTWGQASDVLDTVGKTWQPFGGAGYFVLLALLGLAAAGALVLILLPLVLRRKGRGAPPGPRWWTVGYFGSLGAAFLLVEIPLVQQYILLIGQPATAFAAVVAAVLVSSGLGSLLSPILPWRRGALALAAVAAGFPFLLQWVTPMLLPAPAPIRVGCGILLIVPLALLMGIMFPKGLAHLEAVAPGLVPWAWGINGTVSVVAAVGAALLALSAGFSTVLWVGAACYVGAALLTRVTPHPG